MKEKWGVEGDESKNFGTKVSLMGKMELIWRVKFVQFIHFIL